MTIKLIQDDITKLKVDAIVNAANASLLGGGGVDGAIHKAAGKELLGACKKFNGCETGLVKITTGFLLKAKHVIHAVGPIYSVHPVEIAERLLISAYWESLQLADCVGCKSIAFPNISTGVYGFPKEKAAELAIHTVMSFKKSNPENINQVIFCCFEDENFRIYQKLLNA